MPKDQVRFRRFHQNVIVIGLQAVRVTKPSEPVTDLSWSRQELPAVIVGEENVMPFVASGRDVVQRTGELDAKRSGHGLA